MRIWPRLLTSWNARHRKKPNKVSRIQIGKNDKKKVVSTSYQFSIDLLDQRRMNATKNNTKSRELSQMSIF